MIARPDAPDIGSLSSIVQGCREVKRLSNLTYNLRKQSNVIKGRKVMIDRSQYNESKPLDMHNLQFDIAVERLALVCRCLI